MDSTHDGDTVLVPDARQTFLRQVTLARFHHLICNLLPHARKHMHAVLTGFFFSSPGLLVHTGWFKNTPPDKMNFLDNRVRFLHLNFLICTDRTCYNFEFFKQVILILS